MAEPKAINPEITLEEVNETTAEVKEGVLDAPSKIRQTLGQLAAMWERASVRARVSGSDVVVGSSLSGMYGSKFDALAKEHEQVRPDKG
jgi:hypothetical protein